MRQLMFEAIPVKMLLFLLSVIVAWLIFGDGSFGAVHDFIVTLGYSGLFLAGFFYVYGLTSMPAMAAMLVLAKGYNPVIATVVASLGAFLADITLFLFVRYEFKDEIKKLPIKKFFRTKGKDIFYRIKVFLYVTLAALIIASPLPTEIGIAMMASIKEISPKKFAVIACLLHTCAIAVITLLAETV